MIADVCQINTSKLDDTNKLPLIEASVPLSLTKDDYETFGEVGSYQALGVTALPFPPDDSGYAEGVIVRDVGNYNGALLGARDERCAKVVATMQPGDTILHSCDPQAKAQVRVSANRQVALVTEDSDQNTMALVLDGGENKVQIAAFGGLIEMSENGIALVAPGGKSSILLNKDGSISILGSVQMGGTTGSHNVLCALDSALTAAKAAPAVPGDLATTVTAVNNVLLLLTTAGNLSAEGV